MESEGLEARCECVVPKTGAHQLKRRSDKVAVRSSGDKKVVWFVFQSSDLQAVLRRFVTSRGRRPVMKSLVYTPAEEGGAGHGLGTLEERTISCMKSGGVDQCTEGPVC